MALTVSTDIMKYRESTSDPWKNLIIEPSGTTMYFPSQTVNVASNAEIFRITDAGITTQTVVVEVTFAGPVYDVSWTSYDGYIAFTGTCATATTANVTLGNVSTPTPTVPLAVANGGTGANNAAEARDNLGVHEEYQAGDTIEGQFFLYGYTQSGIKDCVLFLNTPKTIPTGLTITATATNVNWVIANTGALLQSGGTLYSVSRANESQLNVTVRFANNFGGYYACIVPVTDLVITFS